MFPYQSQSPAVGLNKQRREKTLAWMSNWTGAEVTANRLQGKYKGRWCNREETAKSVQSHLLWRVCAKHKEKEKKCSISPAKHILVPDKCKMNPEDIYWLHRPQHKWAHVNFFRWYWDFGINLQRLSMKRPHTEKHKQATATVGFPRSRGVQMGRGMLRWAAFLRKLKPGRTFFQIWVVRQCNVGQAKMGRSTNCQRAAKTRHQRRQVSCGKWPEGRSGLVWPGLSPSAPAACPDHSRAVTDPPQLVPEDQYWYNLHS